jgi:putative transposase
MAADGMNNGAISEKVGLTRAMVGLWRQRFIGQGLMGLYDERRPGGPRSIEDERVSALIKKTIQTKPRGGTHWSCRSIAVETGLSKSTVQRVWHAFGVQPHRQKHFKLSTDPFFVEKVRDIESPGERDGALRRREEPDPGPGPDTAPAADGTRLS